MSDQGSAQRAPKRPQPGGAEGRAGGDRRKRRRGPRRGPRPEPRPTPDAIIAKAKPAVDTSKAADVPLTAEEAAKMRTHFRFLKEHRKLLNLRVNAAEDLLLNGAREPTHRGLCQHLLAKVERSRVEQVVGQLEPAARTRLLEGIIGFSPDIAYLLLYLESLRDASRPEATAALAEALKHLDFAAVSAAQMRRVLDLIVELIDARELPQLLFSLLQSATFQDAFDNSAERLPQPLADIVVPLRAAHAVIVRGQKNPFDAPALARGVGMLLGTHERVLRAQTLPVRQRLFEAGIDLCGESAAKVERGLRTLLDTFGKDERAHGDAGLALCRFLLAAGLEPSARAVLSGLSKEHPGFRAPGRWLEALDGARIGGIGLAARDGGRRPPTDRFLDGTLLAQQQPVWVRIGTPEDGERFTRTIELSQSLASPGVARVIESGALDGGAPYLAIRRLGRAANEVILPKGALKRADALGICAEAVGILSALALASVRLPDARFRRFAVDSSGRLWLRDLLDAERVPPEEARTAHLALAAELCLDVLARADRLLVPEAAIDSIRGAESFAALAETLERLALR